MTDQQPPDRPDRRGCPAGGGTMTPAHGGRIGNPGHKRSEAIASEVKILAKVLSQEMIADHFGFSVEVLTTYYMKEWKAGQRDAIAALGAMVLRKALAGDRVLAMFYLKTRGKWSQRIEHTGPNGGPIREFDLSKIDEDGKRALLAVVDQLLAEDGGELELGPDADLTHAGG